MEIPYWVAQSLVVKGLAFLVIIVVTFAIGYWGGQRKKSPRAISARIVRRHGDIRRIETEIDDLNKYMEDAIRRLEGYDGK